MESGLTLPSMVLVVAALWMLCPLKEVVTWVSVALVAVITYLIVEWNNQCQLLRIRSRMNSVTFLALVSMFPMLHSAGYHFIPVLCLLTAYFCLFKGYGVYRPQGYVFHGFFFIALGSIFFPPLLLWVPTLLISSNVQLRLLFFKSLVAALLGLALPYWLYAAVLVCLPYFVPGGTAHLADGTAHLADSAAVVAAQGLPHLSWQAWTASFTMSCQSIVEWPLWQWGTVCFIVFLGLISVLHFVSTSYNDKIRTRQYFYTLMLQLLPLLFVLIWRPQDFGFVLPLLIFGATPFIAHYFSLARGRAADISFYLWTLTAIILAAANYLDLWKYCIN